MGEELYADQVLAQLEAAVVLAKAASDPISRAQILAQQVQPLAGWATRWAVGDCRRRGLSWPSIAMAMGAQHTTVLRQFTAGGPVITAKPFHSAGTRNDDGQTALRQAAKHLAQQMFPTTQLQQSPTGRLYGAVQAMGDALLTTESPQPLLTTVGELLRQADVIVAEAGYPEAAGYPQEEAIWRAIQSLREVFQRDRMLIEMAAASTTE